MSKKDSMAAHRSKVIRAIQLGSDDTGHVVGQSLKKLREAAGLTPKQMGLRLELSANAVSMIEKNGDVPVQLLRQFVEALGATLSIEATFPATQFTADQFDLPFGTLAGNDQLAFPIFGSEARPSKDLVLSIHPEYTDKIMEGTKTVELRRRFPLTAAPGTVVYIYSTSPIRALVGRAEISDVNKLPLSQIWRKFSKPAGIKRKDFDSYFNGLHEGFALQFSNVKALPRPLTLSELRDRFGFQPPQSFLYASPMLKKALRDEFSSVSY
jgi:predicted transcriptional regulator/DNA-binding XRE family transcriptional regulator